jgi:hypothetical protein
VSTKRGQLQSIGAEEAVEAHSWSDGELEDHFLHVTMERVASQFVEAIRAFQRTGVRTPAMVNFQESLAVAEGLWDKDMRLVKRPNGETRICSQDEINCFSRVSDLISTSMASCNVRTSPERCVDGVFFIYIVGEAIRQNGTPGSVLYGPNNDLANFFIGCGALGNGGAADRMGLSNRLK